MWSDSITKMYGFKMKTDKNVWDKPHRFFRNYIFAPKYYK